MAYVEPGRTDLSIENRLQNALAHANGVVRWWYELGRDTNGYPAAWLWLVVSDELAAKPVPVLLDIAQRLEAEIRADGQFWPYVYFRSQSEQRALEQ